MPMSIKVKSKRRRFLFVPHESAQSQQNHGRLGKTLHLSSQGCSIMEPKGRGKPISLLDETSTRQSEQVEKASGPIGNAEHPNVTVHSMRGEGQTTLSTPMLFATWPPIRDPLETGTSVLQDDTIRECLPLLAGIQPSSRFASDPNAHHVPKLERAKHVEYLHHSLQGLSAKHVGYDASRPWIIYWALLGLCLLGEDVKQYRERS